MAFYGTEVDNKLKEMVFFHNPLEEYDNVTYNIRFYMVSEEYQRKLSELRTNLNKEINIKNEYKVIIAETGVSTNYNMDDLVIKTVYNQKGSVNNMVSYEMTLQLHEVNGCSLMNKITSVSKLLGYDSYINRPYHIDIWFSGYKHGSPMTALSVIGEIYTYEVIVSEVKTNVNDSGTTYSFKMVPTPSIALNKDLNILMNMGEFKSMEGTVLKLKDEIEKTVNDTYFKNNPELLQYYPDKKYIEIEYQDYSKIDYSDMINVRGQIKSRSGLFGKSDSDEPTDRNSTPKFTDSTSEITIKPDNSITLNNIFQEICLVTENYRNVIARPIYKMIAVGSYENQMLYKIKMSVILTKDPYLEWSNNYLKQRLENVNDTNGVELGNLNAQNIIKMQLNALEKMRVERTIDKKYQYMFSGEDTNVLELNTTIDNLWYLNVGATDVRAVVESSKENLKKIAELDNKDQLNMIMTNNELINMLNKSSYKDMSKVRTMAADGRLYLDDVYNCLSKTSKMKLLTERPILEKSDIFSPNESKSIDTNDTAVQQQMARVSLSNMFSSGNLVDIRFTILGDPYWLRIPSDNALYESSSLPDQSKMYHFMFNMKTGMTVDSFSKTGYDLEGVSEITGIYMIVESTSIFKDGKFVQELYGVVDPSFMHSSLIKV